MLTLVVTFKTSTALAYAFGMAVTGTITITTLLFFYVVRHHWRQPLWVVVIAGGSLLAVDLLFFAANLTKLAHGAWLPLLIALVTFTILTTWQRGRALVTRQREHDEGPLRAFIDQVHAMRPPLQRVPGTAIFLNRGKTTTPLAMRANVEHNHILHENVIILALETRPVPHVPAAKRIAVDDLGYKDDKITHVTARFGYLDDPNVPALLPLIRAAGANASSSRPRRSPPTPPNTSTSPATAPSSWAHASSSETSSRDRRAARLRLQPPQRQHQARKCGEDDVAAADTSGSSLHGGSGRAGRLQPRGFAPASMAPRPERASDADYHEHDRVELRPLL